MFFVFLNDFNIFITLLIVIWWTLMKLSILHTCCRLYVILWHGMPKWSAYALHVLVALKFDQRPQVTTCHPWTVLQGNIYGYGILSGILLQYSLWCKKNRSRASPAKLHANAQQGPAKDFSLASLQGADKRIHTEKKTTNQQLNYVFSFRTQSCFPFLVAA